MSSIAVRCLVWVQLCIFAILLIGVPSAKANATGTDATPHAEPIDAPAREIWEGISLSSLDELLRTADMVVDPRQDISRRIRGASVLGESKSRFARPALIAVLNDADADSVLRQVAAASLGDLRDTFVVDHLIDLLRDPDYAVASISERELQEFTGREGHLESLPRDYAGPGRKEIQESWRDWWAANRSRFAREGTAILPLVHSEKPPAKRDLPAGPVIAEFIEERLDFDDKWVKIKDDEVTWSADRIRRSVAFCRVPGVKHIRWLKKPWDQRLDRHVEWQEFAAAPGDQAAEGEIGTGVWAVTVEVEYDDGRKVLIDWEVE